jgi:uncharacterized protein YraI
MRNRFLSLIAALTAPAILLAQQAVATQDVNVRSGQSTTSGIVNRLSAGDTVSLLSPSKVNGYYHVQEQDQKKGWVYARYLKLTTAATVTPPTMTTPSTTTTHVGASAPGKPGSASLAGCGDGLWRHVYNPQRLLVKQQCVTVRGTIVDATNGRQSDGARHEADGDTHAWLKLDPEFKDMLDAGNSSDEGGNLVFEIVCHYAVKQADAKPACSAYSDHTAIPSAGTHVEITGTYVQDTNHGQWNEIHPVSKIVAKP